MGVPRLEYGDLYKFICSVGLILVAAAFGIPWLLLRESSSLLIPASEITLLTPDAQEAITRRQELIKWYGDSAIWISGVLLVIGLGLVCGGLVQWWRKSQKLLDMKSELEAKEINLQARSLSESELRDRTIQEIRDQDQLELTLTESESVGPESQDRVVPQSAAISEDMESRVEEYRSAKHLVMNAIAGCLSANHAIIFDSEIMGMVFDLVATASKQGYTDLVVKVKVIESGVSSTALREFINNAASDLMRYQQVTQREAHGMLMIVVLDPGHVGTVSSQFDQLHAIRRDQITVWIRDTTYWRVFSCEDIQPYSLAPIGA